MPTKYHPASVRQGFEREVRGMERQLSNPTFEWEDKAGYDALKKQREAKAEFLKKITPPPIKDDAERRKLLARKALLEAALKHGDGKSIKPMCDRKQMDDPRAATMQNVSWSKWNDHNIDDEGNVVLNRQYGATCEWKDIQYRLHAELGDDAISAGRIEQLRPTVSTTGLAGTTIPMSFQSPGANLSIEEMEALAKQFPDSKWAECAARERLIQKVPATATDAYVPSQVKAQAAPVELCSATTKAGEPCKSKAGKDGLCASHLRQRRIS